MENDFNCTFHFKGKDDTRICGRQRSECYTTVLEDLQSADFSKKCNCLPDCTSITYEATISQAKNTFRDNYDYRNSDDG